MRANLLGAALEEQGASWGHVPLPYSVELAVFNDLARANAQLKKLGGDAEHVLLFVSPEWVHRTLKYKLMAGMLPESGAAAVLLRNLVGASVVQPDSLPTRAEWVRHAPLTSDVGAYPIEKAAQMAASLLRLHGIPSYPVAMSNTDGSKSWRLFVSAFDAEADAGKRLLIGKA